ncbi:glycoside hydrolase family 9 protein [Sphingomonas sp. CJ99]
MRRRFLTVATAAMLGFSGPALAQDRATPPAQQTELTLSDQEYLEARGVNWLVFSNWYDGLFADAKHSGVELIQQGVRTATNGDVRLSATPGQWDPIGRLVERKVDKATGAIEAVLEYPEHNFRYRIIGTPAGKAMRLQVVLDQPLPEALAGKAGFNLEFLPSAYFHRSYLADGRGGTFPAYPRSAMVAGEARNAASGREVGPGAETQPFATGTKLVLAPEDDARRVTISSASGPLALHDGRNMAQNGWFVVRGALPSGKTGAVIDWMLEANSVPGWTRAPNIGHSQVGYAPGQKKVAVIELDANARPAANARLIRITETGEQVAGTVPTNAWGKYKRYQYLTADFTATTAPGLYQIDYAGTRTSTFRIGADVFADAWHATNDVFMNVQMDHMFVNEAYRVWHSDPHRDDARQAPVNHEHIDLYRQGPTTDTKFKPGEHVPGLNVGGWLDAGDFDIRTQTQYAAIRGLVNAWETWQPARDTTLIDNDLRRVEMHVPDGKPDVVQQVAHGTRYLVSMYDAVGYAVHGVVEPDVAQYTHLGDAAAKTDGLIYDSALKFGEEKGGRSGKPDDRWVFTSKSSALNYGSAAAMAAAARVMGGVDDALAAKARKLAIQVWDEEQSHPPFTFSHGNTTGGPLEAEQFDAAVELLLTTGDKAKYAPHVVRLWDTLAARKMIDWQTALKALPMMDADYRAKLEAAAREWATVDAELAKANPFGVPVTEGGWAGSGAVVGHGLTAYALHKAFPAIVDGSAVFRSMDFLMGTHPYHNLSLVSGVGTRSKEVAYGSNRADFSYIAGGVVPGILMLKPDFPENKEDWPFFWGENEYVVNLGPAFIQLANAANELAGKK